MAPSAQHDNCDAHTTSSKLSTVSSINASVLHGPRDVRLETRTISAPLSGELQISIRSTGICGSDVSYYRKFANGDLCACSPLSLGHESSGVVVAVGAAAGASLKSGLKIGDRVALEVGIPCGECGICRKGRYNLCKRMRFRSSAKSVPHFQGTLQERINHPQVWCHKLPDHVSFDAAALLEPLSVAIHAVNRAAPIEPGSTALVVGAGTVGLLTAAMSRHSGCTSVTIVDVDAGRVAYALDKGFATHGYVVARPSHSASSSGTSTPATAISVDESVQQQLDAAKLIATEIQNIAFPAAARDEDPDEDTGFDVSFECTGKQTCMQSCIYATRPGGKVIMVGMGTPIQTLPISAAHLREVDILGVFRYANTYRTGIALLGDGGLNIGGRKGCEVLEGLVTHRFKGLENAGDALNLAGRTVDEDGRLVLKVVIEA